MKKLISVISWVISDPKNIVMCLRRSQFSADNFISYIFKNPELFKDYCYTLTGEVMFCLRSQFRSYLTFRLRSYSGNFNSVSAEDCVWSTSEVCARFKTELRVPSAS